MNKRVIEKDLIIDYYITQNHSWKETLIYFHTSSATLSRLIKEYNISKPKDLHVINIKKSKQTHYGDPNYNNRDKAAQTNLNKYGVDNQFKRKEFIREAWQDKLGVSHPMKSPIISEKSQNNHNYVESIAKTHVTCLEKYGYDNPRKVPEIKERIIEKLHESCLRDTGYDYYCLRPEAHSHKKYSKTNTDFHVLLEDNGFNVEDEFVIGKYSYDFKINDNTLIELNPTITHNSTFSVFNNKPKDRLYHTQKNKAAIENGYRCINIWDWDDKDKLINSLKSHNIIYARKCNIKEVNKRDADEFLNNYHLQSTCKNQSVRLGLYYNNKLICIMTFGKPRYNRNYEYELLRLCTLSDYKVIGGSQKLFSYFIKQYNPTSIISYCDNSKFTGEVYGRLGFKLKSYGVPSKHWYNMKTKKHITDNLLRQRGFDQLFGTNYGKGTSNDQLMLDNGFVEIYDCGQSIYVWENNL